MFVPEHLYRQAKLLEDLKRLSPAFEIANLREILERGSVIAQLKEQFLWAGNLKSLYDAVCPDLTFRAAAALGHSAEVQRVLELERNKLLTFGDTIAMALASDSLAYAKLWGTGIEHIAADLTTSFRIAERAERLLPFNWIHKWPDLGALTLPLRFGIEEAATFLDTIKSFSGETAEIIAGISIRELASYERYAAGALSTLVKQIEDDHFRILQQTRIEVATRDVDIYMDFTSRLAGLEFPTVPIQPIEIRPLLGIRTNLYDAFDYESSRLSIPVEQPKVIVIPSADLSKRTIALIDRATDYDNCSGTKFFNRSSKIPAFSAKIPRIIVTDEENCGRWSILLYKFFVQGREQDYRELVGRRRVMDDILILRANAGHDKSNDPNEDRRKEFFETLKQLYFRRCGETYPRSRDAWIRLQESVIADLEQLIEELHNLI